MIVALSAPLKPYAVIGGTGGPDESIIADCVPASIVDENPRTRIVDEGAGVDDGVVAPRDQKYGTVVDRCGGEGRRVRDQAVVPDRDVGCVGGKGCSVLDGDLHVRAARLGRDRSVLGSSSGLTGDARAALRICPPFRARSSARNPPPRGRWRRGRSWRRERGAAGAIGSCGKRRRNGGKEPSEQDRNEGHSNRYSIWVSPLLLSKRRGRSIRGLICSGCCRCATGSGELCRPPRVYRRFPPPPLYFGFCPASPCVERAAGRSRKFSGTSRSVPGPISSRPGLRMRVPSSERPLPAGP